MKQISINHRTRRVLAVSATAALVCAGAAMLTTQTASGADTSRPGSSTRIAKAAGSSLEKASQAARAGADVKAPGPRALGLPRSGSYAFLLQLDTASTATAQRSAPGGVDTAAARSAATSQLARVQSAQDAVIAKLPAATSVIYRTHAVLAGVAVRSDVTNLSALRAIPGVKSVRPIAPKTPNNSYAVPLQGAPAVWTRSFGVPGNTGKGTSLGIIDTGIDYTHANFGGAGTVAAYDAAFATDTVAPAAGANYGPGHRVVGGTDLVGDDYNAAVASGPALIPHPDPNPLDCEGHGSHVAGSAGGSGENADGSTYTGAYDTSTPFQSLRIGPGMAPQADLYAIRVFGCEGSTNVVTEAFDYAVDPNGDGNTADHLDVVNLSLGSDFGTPYDADALAADAAAQAGVFSSISSGNAGDVYDVGGSPGTAVRALTVAASVDAQSVVDTLNVTIGGAAKKYAAERSVAFNYANGDLAGPVVLPPDGVNGTGCNTPTGGRPYPAGSLTGKVVVLKWTQEALECGSVQRSGNVAFAGGIGFIFANSQETFSAGITGSAAIPGVLVSKSGGDAIKAALTAGTAVQALSTSAADFKQQVVADNDTLTSFTSRGTHDAGAIKPDVSAVGATVFSTLVASGNQGENESGTSMAAPMTAGLAALVRTANPSWSVEQVKADIINTAGQDLYTAQNHIGTRYAPNRVGTGRIQAAPAAANKVLAYASGGSGGVGVSFGPVEVTGPTTLTKTVTVANKGTSAATYATSYDAITTVPGVSYSVTPASVTVAAGSTSTVTVTMSIPDPTVLTKTVDATKSAITSIAGFGSFPAETLADASGHLLLTPSAGSAPQLRVAVYSAPRPASTLTAPATATFPAGSDTTTVAVSGTGVDQGTGSAAVRSAVAGLQLLSTSGVAPACVPTGTTPVTDSCTLGQADAAADLKYVGAAADDAGLDADERLSYVGIVAQAPSSTPANRAEYDVYLDVDGDGSPDLVGYNTRLTQANGDNTDTFVVDWVDLATGQLADEQYLDGRDATLDLAVFDSDSIMMPILQSTLLDYGLDATDPRVGYGVISFGSSSGQQVDALGIDLVTGELDGLSFNPITPGVTVTNSAGVAPAFFEAPGDPITITRDAATLADDAVDPAALLIHFHNKAGSKAQVVTLTDAPSGTPTGTPTVTGSPTASGTPTVTGSPTATGTPTGTPTVTGSPRPPARPPRRARHHHGRPDEHADHQPDGDADGAGQGERPRCAQGQAEAWRGQGEVHRPDDRHRHGDVQGGRQEGHQDAVRRQGLGTGQARLAQEGEGCLLR